jgi:hypothetical protein
MQEVDSLGAKVVVLLPGIVLRIRPKYKFDPFDVNGPGTYLIVPASQQGTDWLGAILQKAPMVNHQVTASGGADNANYLFGLDYFDQKGIVYTTRYQRYSVRA